MKILALKEGFRTKIASITEEYEERIADLRIELTELDEKYRQSEAENQNLQSTVQQLREQLSPVDEPLEGDGSVQEEESTNKAD